MKLLITGATGFIGRACVRAALARGHVVAALAHRAPAQSHAGPIVRIEGGLADPDWRAIESFAPESCLHTAWVTAPGEYLSSPLNGTFQKWSLAFLRGLVARGLGHAIILGTCLEYAPQRAPMREDVSPLGPASPYAQGKDALRRELELLGFAMGWARLFFPYGPGEDPRRLATSIIGRISRNEEVALKTPDSVRDYIFVEDVAEALLVTLEERVRGAINIGTGVGVTVREIAQTVAEIIGVPVLIAAPETVPDPYDFLVADSTRLRALGWRPRTSLAEGLRSLVRSLVH